MLEKSTVATAVMCSVLWNCWISVWKSTLLAKIILWYSWNISSKNCKGTLPNYTGSKCEKS